MAPDLYLFIWLVLASLSATFIYGTGSPFWKHITGIGLFTVLLSFSIIVSLTMAGYFGYYDPWVSRGAIALTAAALTAMTIIIAREQILGENELRAKRRAERERRREQKEIPKL